MSEKSAAGRRFQRVAGLAGLILLLVPLLAAPASAKSHLWRMNEFFSDSSGMIQFIEFSNDTSSSEEILLDGSTVESNTVFFDPGENLVGDTAFKKLLMATQGFADLPGAPTPDFILPAPFFDPASDVIRYISIVQIVTLEDVPTDGLHSVDMLGAVGVNTPTNFAGDTATIVVTSPPSVPALPTALWLGGVLASTATALVYAGARRRPRPPSTRRAGAAFRGGSDAP